jgi:hypothetical protein
MTLHYVNPEPFDPAETERLTPEQERFYTASQWQLMWWKFRRHRIAVFAVCKANSRALIIATVIKSLKDAKYFFVIYI